MLYQYLGDGFLPNVPARDLTAEEAESFDAAWLLSSGLYRIADPPPAAPAASEEPEESQP